MRKPTVLALLAAVAALLMFVGQGTARTDAGAFTTETLQLDTFESTNDGAAGPVTTSQALAAGQEYLITVGGTFSVYIASHWETMFVCGAAEPAPEKLSPGTTNGQVGWDAEVEFAAPSQVPCDEYVNPPPKHSPGSQFEMDIGSGFSHIEPTGGPFSSPSPDHVYRYEVTGQGSPASFRFADNPSSDNYGVLTITLDQLVGGTATPTPTPTRTPTPTPTVIVGGISVDPDMGALPLETAGSSGGSVGVLAAIVAGATTGAIALGGAAWYVRRRR